VKILHLHNFYHVKFWKVVNKLYKKEKNTLQVIPKIALYDYTYTSNFTMNLKKYH